MSFLRSSQSPSGSSSTSLVRDIAVAFRWAVHLSSDKSQSTALQLFSFRLD